MWNHESEVAVAGALPQGLCAEQGREGADWAISCTKSTFEVQIATVRAQASNTAVVLGRNACLVRHSQHSLEDRASMRSRVECQPPSAPLGGRELRAFY